MRSALPRVRIDLNPLVRLECASETFGGMANERADLAVSILLAVSIRGLKSGHPNPQRCPELTPDRDRGTPRDATPPTPPGIRVPYHGGSTELGLGGRTDLGKTERLEIGVAEGLLDRRMSGHAPEPGW